MSLRSPYDASSNIPPKAKRRPALAKTLFLIRLLPTLANIKIDAKKT